MYEAQTTGEPLDSKVALFMETANLVSKVGEQMPNHELLRSIVSQTSYEEAIKYVAAIEDAIRYFVELRGFVDNPDIGKTPKKWNLFGRLCVNLAEANARDVLNKIYYSDLNKISSSAEAALDGDLSKAIIAYYKGTDEGEQEPLIKPDEQIDIKPFLKAIEMRNYILNMKNRL